MKWSPRFLIAFAVFSLIAAAGIALSISAPHIRNDDESVYLVGALQARDGNLPDAYMLQGYEYGPYLHPKIMLTWYEQLGDETFKSIYLFILVIATGFAGYFLFRSLALGWIPSLALSALLLLPRTAAGTEFFGVFTFREAIGRSAALPLFLVGTALILRRMSQNKALWPVFALLGICLFFHPVTVTLFAFISLITVGIVRLAERMPLWKIVREGFVSGIAFLIAGSYFFYEVFARLANNVATEGASSAAYVTAVLFRNAWEFPAASLGWYKHILIISLFFLIAIAAVQLVPKLKALRNRYLLPGARRILTYGIALMVGSLVLTLLIPGLNLYFMEHANAPYVFQQWSRMSKFFYLGLFVALVPAAHLLWQWYAHNRSRVATIVLAACIAAGAASSTLAFEAAQFALGYPNYTAAYIPQALSGVPDGTSIDDYHETCAALTAMGAAPEDQIVSTDFGLRYYCRANLYVTNEEGAAYTYLERSDLIGWYENFMAQRAAINTVDLETLKDFARSVDASYIVLVRIEKFKAFETSEGAVLTKQHILLPVGK